MTTADSPSRFGHYDVERPLGRGAMGTVYVARDSRIGRRVALKTIQVPEQQFEDAGAAEEFFLRLQREAEVCGSLLHPNIVTLYEAGYENGRISFLAMELVDGETLLDVIKRARPSAVALDVALRMATDVLRGLVHAHDNGIVHRDIKPANILIAADGMAKIADFGIARPQQSTMTMAGSLLGTPNYMSPEQVTGAALTPRADLFSLGVVLYEMLTGVKPFAAADITAILHKILRVDPPHASELNPSVPRPVGDFIVRLLQKSPEARPSTAEALATVEALARGPQERSAPALPPAQPSADRWQKRVEPRSVAIVVGGAILVAAIAVAVLGFRIDDSPTATIPPQRLAEFDEKRRALLNADTLFNDGKYEESLRAYEAYLVKYPHSVAAEEGRARASAALAQTASADAAAQRKARSRARKDEDISPREMLDRIKRVFRK